MYVYLLTDFHYEIDIQRSQYNDKQGNINKHVNVRKQKNSITEIDNYYSYIQTIIFEINLT